MSPEMYFARHVKIQDPFVTDVHDLTSPVRATAHFVAMAEDMQEQCVLDAIIDEAKRFISLASDITSRDLLDMHYMWGWSLGKIAANTNCSIKTIARKRDMALAQLKDALNKKEAEA